MHLPRIVLTAGEPAGIGAEVILKAAQKDWPAELVVVTDPTLLTARAAELNIPVQLELLSDLNHAPTPHQPGILKIIPEKMAATCIAGQLNQDNAPFVLSALKRATQLCLNHEASALVTGPVQKSLLNTIDPSFQGHTEFLSTLCGSPQTLMLFVVDALKVALVTTHIPLSKVPTAITQEKLINTIHLLNTELKNRFSIQHPHIFVCGLNPHAGEQGLLGREEIDVIEPALFSLRQEGVQITGPLPADTMFTASPLQKADVILAMYHDQALPVIKHIGFDRAVNVTLGLPIIRTSPDHGTALDIAGTGKASCGSMMAAIELAIYLRVSRPRHFSLSPSQNRT